MTDNTGEVCRFRNIGSRGLVVFERDGTLLKERRLSKDLALGDISHPFIKLLRRFRRCGVRFGFISNDRGMDAARGGSIAATTLMELIDAILRTNSAEPDFWMAMPFSQTADRPSNRKTQQFANPSLMILRAVERYGIEREKAIFVGSSAECTQAASMAGLATINFASPSLPRGESSADFTDLLRADEMVSFLLDLDRNH